jgi:hypothetical protein
MLWKKKTACRYGRYINSSGELKRGFSMRVGAWLALTFSQLENTKYYNTLNRKAQKTL